MPIRGRDEPIAPDALGASMTAAREARLPLQVRERLIDRPLVRIAQRRRRTRRRRPRTRPTRSSVPRTSNQAPPPSKRPPSSEARFDPPARARASTPKTQTGQQAVRPQARALRHLHPATPPRPRRDPRSNPRSPPQPATRNREPGCGSPPACRSSTRPATSKTRTQNGHIPPGTPDHRLPGSSDSNSRNCRPETSSHGQSWTPVTPSEVSDKEEVPGSSPGSPTRQKLRANRQVSEKCRSEAGSARGGALGAFGVHQALTATLTRPAAGVGKSGQNGRCQAPPRSRGVGRAGGCER